jgi:ParB family chromosome partitioning protein
MGLEELQNIPVDKIRPSKYPLRPIDDKIVEELMQSIESQGLLQPIMVRPLGDNFFELIFGNHRLEAYRRLRMKTIPCRVREMDDSKAFMTVEVENLQKNNFIDPIAEAKGFQMLIQQGLTETDIGKAIGKTQQYASARLGLLRLEPEIQAQITSRLVSTEHGYELSKIEDVKRRIILAELSMRNREDCLSLKELREMAKMTIEELSKDARVDTILLRDPTERMRRIEAMAIDLVTSHLHLSEHVLDFSSRLQVLEKRTYFVIADGTWKRDHCTHYNSDICDNWAYEQEVANLKMTRDGNNWKLRVSQHPEKCATCIGYTKKRSQP